MYIKETGLAFLCFYFAILSPLVQMQGLRVKLIVWLNCCVKFNTKKTSASDN